MKGFGPEQRIPFGDPIQRLPAVSSKHIVPGATGISPIPEDVVSSNTRRAPTRPWEASTTTPADQPKPQPPEGTHNAVTIPTSPSEPPQQIDVFHSRETQPSPPPVRVAAASASEGQQGSNTPPAPTKADGSTPSPEPSKEAITDPSPQQQSPRDKAVYGLTNKHRAAIARSRRERYLADRAAELRSAQSSTSAAEGQQGSSTPPAQIATSEHGSPAEPNDKTVSASPPPSEPESPKSEESDKSLLRRIHIGEGVQARLAADKTAASSPATNTQRPKLTDAEWRTHIGEGVALAWMRRRELSPQPVPPEPWDGRRHVRTAISFADGTSQILIGLPTSEIHGHLQRLTDEVAAAHPPSSHPYDFFAAIAGNTSKQIAGEVMVKATEGLKTATGTETNDRARTNLQTLAASTLVQVVDDYAAAFPPEQRNKIRNEYMTAAAEALYRNATRIVAATERAQARFERQGRHRYPIIGFLNTSTRQELASHSVGADVQHDLAPWYHGVLRLVNELLPYRPLGLKETDIQSIAAQAKEHYPHTSRRVLERHIREMF